MTFDDLRRRIADALFDAWASESGLGEPELRAFIEHGIPADWAEEFDALFAIPPSAWPKVIPSPKHRTEVLHKRLRSSRVNEPMMPKNHRLAISEGHKSDDDDFAKTIRAKGFSQNSLAKRVGLNQAVLSLHRKGLRQIKQPKAKAIERLTGWPADAKHWPGGIASE